MTFNHQFHQQNDELQQIVVKRCHSVDICMKFQKNSNFSNLVFVFSCDPAKPLQTEISVTQDLINRVSLRRTGSLDSAGDEFARRYWFARIVMALHRAACAAMLSKIADIKVSRQTYPGFSSDDTFLRHEDENFAAAERGMAW